MNSDNNGCTFVVSSREDCLKYTRSKQTIYRLGEKSYDYEGLSDEDISDIRYELAINEGDFKDGLKDLISYTINPKYHEYLL